MAATRVDLEIGEDPTAGKSPTHRESRSSSESSVTGEAAKKRKIDGMGRLVIPEDRREISRIRGSNSPVRDHPGNKRSPPGGEKKPSKNKNATELADNSKSFHAEIKDRKSSRRDDAYELPADRNLLGVVSGNDSPIQIKKQRGTRARRQPESEQTSISARVIYKLVGPSRQRGGSQDVGKKEDPREVSPRRRARNHANLMVDTTEGLGGAGTEVARKLADCQRDRSTVKRREDAEKRIAGSSTGQESPRVSEPRSSNDATPVRKVRRHVGQAKCDNCGKSHLCNDRSYLHKYSGFLDCEGLPLDENYAREANGRECKHEAPVASLPLLSVHDSGVACSGNEPAVGHAHNSKQLVTDLKQLHTLKQHYYPEGGWGWVVMFVGVLVQMLSHGVHGSNGVFLQQVARKFDRRVYFESG